MFIKNSLVLGLALIGVGSLLAVYEALPNANQGVFDQTASLSAKPFQLAEIVGNYEVLLTSSRVPTSGREFKLEVAVASVVGEAVALVSNQAGEFEFVITDVAKKVVAQKSLALTEKWPITLSPSGKYHFQVKFRPEGLPLPPNVKLSANFDLEVLPPPTIGSLLFGWWTQLLLTLALISFLVWQSRKSAIRAAQKTGAQFLEWRFLATLLLASPILAHYLLLPWLKHTNPTLLGLELGYWFWLLATPVQFIFAWPIYQLVWRSVWHGLAQREVLLVLATSAAYVYSLIGLLFFGRPGLWFATAPVWVLFWLSRYLEMRFAAGEEAASLQPATPLAQRLVIWSEYLVSVTIVLAVASFAFLLFGARLPFSFAFEQMLAVLLISAPWSLVLSVLAPLATGFGDKSNITLVPTAGLDYREMLSLAAALAKASPEFLHQTLAKKGQSELGYLPEVKDFTLRAEQGISGRVLDKQVVIKCLAVAKENLVTWELTFNGWVAGIITLKPNETLLPVINHRTKEGLGLAILYHLLCLPLAFGATYLLPNLPQVNIFWAMFAGFALSFVLLINATFSLKID